MNRWDMFDKLQDIVNDNYEDRKKLHIEIDNFMLELLEQFGHDDLASEIKLQLEDCWYS